MESDSRCIFSFDYKHIGGKPVALEVYLPVLRDCGSQPPIRRPVVIYFHGGALTVGNKRSWVPTWLQSRLSAQRFIFISADYRLMPPATGHDIVEDIQDVFRFVATSLNSRLDEAMSDKGGADPIPAGDNLSPRNPYRIDAEAIGVAGTSAGGLCAYLACMHADPKPRVVLNMYGMGGKLYNPHYFTPKSEPFFRGRELLDPQQFRSFLHPQSSELEPTSDSPLAYHPPTYDIPGYPSNPRMLLGRLYLQLGTYLDYYTGMHEPSLSAYLRSLPVDLTSRVEGLRANSIPEQHRPLFPQFAVTSAWPPTCLVHGSADTAVLIEESRHMHSLLMAANVDVELWEVDGAEHSFDYEPPTVGTSYETLFHDAVKFLIDHLNPSTT
ncbi:Alpha/Beta hydrolase protein [Pisolithus marmoratus]|nr:Alpha/Beta hydrolase protein [Pisolithus marmoratus]